jgi:hypothetical protein
VNILARVARLEEAIPPPPPPSREERSVEVVLHLFFDVILSAPFTDEEAGRVLAALQIEPDSASPFYNVLRAIRNGWCRVPEMAPATMRDVVLAMIDRPPAALPAMTCNGCGMLAPRCDDPCLVCGADKKDRIWPWMSSRTARWLQLDRHLKAPEA